MPCPPRSGGGTLGATRSPTVKTDAQLSQLGGLPPALALRAMGRSEAEGGRRHAVLGAAGGASALPANLHPNLQNISRCGIRLSGVYSLTACIRPHWRVAGTLGLTEEKTIIHAPLERLFIGKAALNCEA